MALLRAELVFIDKTTKPLQSIIGHLNAVQKSFRGLDTSGGVFRTASADIQGLNAPLARATQSVEVLNRSAKKSVGTFRQLRYSILNAFIMIMALKSTARTITSLTDGIDQFNRTMARLDLVDRQFNSLNPNVDLFYRKILDGSERARISFDELAQQVSKLGLQAGHAFSGTDEIIRFSELASKSFKIAGTSAESQRAAMYQLTQALASNRLQGDEFRSIIENMPQLTDMLNKKLGTTHAELRALASEGKISARVIKDAMFENADEIERRFRALPYTIGERFMDVKRTFEDAMRPFYEMMGRMANSPEFIQFIEYWKQQARDLAQTLQDIVLWLQRTYRWLQENKWAVDLVVSALHGVLAALIAINAQKAFVAMKASIALMNPYLLAVVAIVAAIIFIARRMGYTWEEIWFGMKVVVSVFYNTLVGIIGAIVMIVAMLGIGIYNMLVGLVNVFMGTIYALFAIFNNIAVFFVNAWEAVKEFFINSWVDMKYNAQMSIYHLRLGWAQFIANLKNAWGNGMNWLIDKAEAFANAFIGLINKLVDSLNGSKLLSGLNKVLSLAGMGTIEFGKVGNVSWGRLNTDHGIDPTGLTAPVRGEYYTKKAAEAYMSVADMFSKGMNTYEYMDLDGAMTDIGAAISGMMWFPERKKNEYFDHEAGSDYDRYMKDTESFLSGADGLPEQGTGTGGSGKAPNVGSVGKIKEPVKLSDETMKLFRRIADGEFLRGYATINPNIYLTYTSNNMGSSDEAVEKSARTLERMILEELSTNLKIN